MSVAKPRFNFERKMHKNRLKYHLHRVIFGTSTRLGRSFDIMLIALIILSILLVMLESVESLNIKYKDLFFKLEWVVTIIFTLEYALRIWIVRKSARYIFSFYGIVDFLAILPSYLGLFLVGFHGLTVIRGIRLLRIFRILKLNRYSRESRMLIESLKASRAKISVFLFFVVTLVVIIGTIMYMIEGAENGFTSIPQGIYWAIVTLTTVGYGDISPGTNLGQFIASVVMILGYAIIAVPTGIVSAGIVRMNQEKKIKSILDDSDKVCLNCTTENHEIDAVYCKHCGGKLDN